MFATVTSSGPRHGTVSSNGAPEPSRTKKRPRCSSHLFNRRHYLCEGTLNTPKTAGSSASKDVSTVPWASGNSLSPLRSNAPHHSSLPQPLLLLPSCLISHFRLDRSQTRLHMHRIQEVSSKHGGCRRIFRDTRTEVSVHECHVLHRITSVIYWQVKQFDSSSGRTLELQPSTDKIVWICPRRIRMILKLPFFKLTPQAPKR
ncbi:hypothetical protein EDB19DRAFT_469821 [Suillus lakei]|nr:hypothetical protein EDB19DRAFT_469821 [Suillus lakei]